MTDTKKLVQKAIKARENSYSPYSNYPVGAALLGADGDIYTGTNVENGVNGLSICAERVALFKAVSEGTREFERLAVVCEDEYCKPCGACRQTLIEHAPDLEIIMANPEGNYRSVGLKDLLPEAFNL
ncbi:MAG: cytidine deaminase [Candidatus Bipolaricaulota bacterium]|nr:cytidine deaminase [Candidatus Bipolaricaulota bacterium]MBS3791283.1 cytidine deaminase [Candidatus Bipolaricaulota bacterium]